MTPLQKLAQATELLKKHNNRVSPEKEAQVIREARLRRAATEGAALAKEAFVNPELCKVAQMMPQYTVQGPPRSMYDQPLQFSPNPALRASHLAGGMATAMAVGAGTKAISTLMGRAIDRAYTSLTEGKDKTRAYARMMQSSPHLGKEESVKVQRAFNSLYRWMPDAARDPLVASSFVQRAVDYGGVAMEEVDRLVKARKGLIESRAQEGLMASKPSGEFGSDQIANALAVRSVTNDFGWRG